MKTNFKIKKITILFTIAMLSLYSCNTESLSSDLSSVEAVTFKANMVAKRGHGKVIHHVSLGSNDVCAFIGQPNGCNANLSLAANLYEDGFVSGQWQDTFGGGGEGIHVDIDCANFIDEPIGYKYAIVSGIITNGTVLGQDVSGQRAVIFAADHGPGNQDDFMSFSILSADLDCNLLTWEDDIISGSIVPLITGEVVIR